MRVVPDATSIVPCDAPSVTPRVVDIVSVAVDANVPPFKMTESTTADPGIAPSPRSPEIDTVPPLTTKPPEKVFVPVIVNVPEPSFVTAVAPVATGSGMVTLPEPVTVSAKLPATPFPLDTSIVSVPEFDLIVDAAASVTVPVIVLLPEALTMTPLLLIPVPATVSGSVMAVRPPEMLSTAPSAIVVPAEDAPSAEFDPTITVPVEIVVDPEYEFVPLNVSESTPVSLESPPDPVMLPDNT